MIIQVMKMIDEVEALVGFLLTILVKRTAFIVYDAIKIAMMTHPCQVTGVQPQP